MNIGALLTSAGINIAICAVFLFLYSILRKQPSYKGVYFGRTPAQAPSNKHHENSCCYRFVPSPRWIGKAWTTTEEEILADAGLDAVVFIRIIVFSIRIFSIAAVICLFLVLPLNYHGKKMTHINISSESLDVFSIVNVADGSTWLGGHCFALYVISCSACVLLYIDYKSITKMRLAHFIGSPPNPSHFALLVRSIPKVPLQSYSDTVRIFFTNYHARSYLSHQMVYRNGKIQKIMSGAEKMYNVVKTTAIETIDHNSKPDFIQCHLCGSTSKSFKILSNESESEHRRTHSSDLHITPDDKECASAAFVFFKTRYAAVIAAHVLQSSNPMLWVTDSAPEPHDVYWSNLCIPYKQLWIRRIATLSATLLFMVLFLIPVTFVQGLTQLDQLQKMFPFLKEALKNKIISQVATGYLPSLILLVSLLIVPPIMMVFSAVEGSISRSGRKKSAACKVLFFTIWNVFFVNVLSGTAISRLNAISSPKDIPSLLAAAVPAQASFFMTYVLTSGWASLSAELMQPFALICNLFRRFILRKTDYQSSSNMSFPYQTEVPKVLLFGLLGFTCSILAPLILPLLLIYYLVAYLVYRNQILNVYVNKYESGGQFWPVVHNTTIFSLLLTQVIALGMFGLKRSPVASAFTIPLIISTLLFNEYCRQRFHPIYDNNVAEVLIEKDRQDEHCGRMEEIHQQCHLAYCQIIEPSNVMSKDGDAVDFADEENIPDLEDMKPGKETTPVASPLYARCMEEEPTDKSG